MRRLLVLTVPLFLFGCVAEGVHGARPPPSVQVAEPPARPDGSEEAAGPSPAVLTVSGATSDGATRLHIEGQLDHSSAPVLFRLRTELGCAHETKLEVTRAGSRFSVGLREEDLADAFACAMDAESGEASLSPITVTPDATSTTTATDIRLDRSFFAVAARDLDARSGHVIRFNVAADGPLAEAHLTLGGVTYAATLAPLHALRNRPVLPRGGNRVPGLRSAVPGRMPYARRRGRGRGRREERRALTISSDHHPARLLMSRLSSTAFGEPCFATESIAFPSRSVDVTI